MELHTGEFIFKSLLAMINPLIFMLDPILIYYEVYVRF